MTKTKKITLVFALVFIIIPLSSCGNSSNGKSKFCDVLFSDYASQVEFFFESENGSVSGTANVLKSDFIRIDVTSPDPFSGISAEITDSGENNLITVSFSGIKAELPADAIEKISLISSAFGDGAAAEIKNTPSDKFKKCGEIFELEGVGIIDAYVVEIPVNNMDYTFIYDKNTGYPVYVCVKSGESRAEIKIKKIKIEEAEK